VIGETLGSYRIISQLGAGAMGEVYLAEHRYLKRKAALKLLSSALVDRPDLLERFFLEARATSAIAHPGIVQIFDCEVAVSGRPYIVMEYLAGETLAARLVRTRPLPVAVVARLARAMAEALDAAHAKGIVHRDLKPENIFVEETPADTIKLVDFGIAKLAGDFRAEQVHQTRTGSMMGTPLYMSPEQCRDSAKLDFRTDLYSLGCVMFEMLTGRPPFTHRALGELIVAHLTESPQDARALNPAVPAVLAQLCAALLQKDPAARPAHMREVADRLNQFSATATTVPGPIPTEAAPPPSSASMPLPAATTLGASEGKAEATVPPPTVSRRRGLLLVGAGVLVLVIGAGAVALSRRGPPSSVIAPLHEASAAPPSMPPAPPPPTTLAAPPSATHETVPARPTIADKKTSPRARAWSASNKNAPAAGELRAPSLQAEEGAAQSPAAKRMPDGADDRAPSVPAVVHAAGVVGSWEGPWNDPGKHQKGRFFLQIGDDGAVVGWMFNTAAAQSFRLMGRAAPGGQVELACQCPADRTFNARGELRVDAHGQLVGNLSLFTGAGAFGESHLTLRRKASR
jgi:serine/threonine protein kinase